MRGQSLETCLATKILVCLLLLRCKEARGSHKSRAVSTHFFKHHAGASADGDGRAETIRISAATSTVGCKTQALLHPDTDFSFSLLSCHTNLRITRQLDAAMLSSRRRKSTQSTKKRNILRILQDKPCTGCCRSLASLQVKQKCCARSQTEKLWRWRAMKTA